MEAALRRSRGGRRILVVPADERVAKLVGAFLHHTASGSQDLADAHVVAVYVGVDTAAVHGVRVLTRAP